MEALIPWAFLVYLRRREDMGIRGKRHGNAKRPIYFRTAKRGNFRFSAWEVPMEVLWEFYRQRILAYALLQKLFMGHVRSRKRIQKKHATKRFILILLRYKFGVYLRRIVGRIFKNQFYNSKFIIHKKPFIFIFNY